MWSTVQCMLLQFCCRLDITCTDQCYFLIIFTDRTEVRYDYKRMNIEGAREELQLIKWKEVMNGTANDNGTANENIKKDSKSFFAYVRGRSQATRRSCLGYSVCSSS